MNAQVLDLLIRARLLNIDNRTECIKMVGMIDEAIRMLRNEQQDN